MNRLNLPNFISQRLTTNNNTSPGRRSKTAEVIMTNITAGGRRSNNTEGASTAAATATMSAQASRPLQSTAINTADTAAASRNDSRPQTSAAATSTTAAAAAAAGSTLNSQTSTLSSASSTLGESQITSRTTNTTASSTVSNGGTWSELECCLLAQSWVHVSTDEAKGTDQRGDGMWARIFCDFNRRVGLAKLQHPELSESFKEGRTQKILTNYWSGTENKALQRFAATCRQNPPKSGENDEVKYYERMMKLYFKQQKASKSSGCPLRFDKFLMAYHHVKSQPKWLETISPKRSSASTDDQELQSKRKRPKGRGSAKADNIIKKTVGEASKAAESESSRRWHSVEDQLSGLVSNYGSMREAIVMANAPEEMKSEYFKVQAQKIMAEQRRRDLQQQQRDSDVVMMDPSSGKSDEERREEQNRDDDGDEDEEESRDDGSRRSVIVVDDDGESSSDQGDDEDNFADPEVVHQAVAAAKLCHHHAIPGLVLRPKKDMDVNLDSVFDALPADVRSTVVTSSQDDVNAIEQQLRSRKVKARVYNMSPASCLSKYDVTTNHDAPYWAVQLNECVNVDLNNPAEIMAFNYVIDQIEIENQGGISEAWNNACEQIDAEREAAATAPEGPS